jgi:hypothetical protein
LNIREFVLSIILALMFAVCLLFALNNTNASKMIWAATIVGVDSNARNVVSLEETTPYASNVQSTRTPFVKTTIVSPTPTLIPLKVGSERGEDFEDVLLLYDSTHINNFDINFCNMVEYYGLVCKRIAIDNTYLTEDLLRDRQGNYFKLVGISAETLLQLPSPLSFDEVARIKFAIEKSGVNILISNVNDSSDFNFLSELTDGAIQGITKPLDSIRDWIFSSKDPDITRELSGQTISSESTDPQGDFALIINQQIPFISLISSKDDIGVIYPIFVKLERGLGSIFIDASQPATSLHDYHLKEMYYDTYFFSNIFSLMSTIRYALGNEAWHSDSDFANLTIDDPTLTEPFGLLSFVDLLPEMEAHNFHTTIAMHPVSWFDSEPEVIALFLAYPNRYSLVQHGNNGDGYEFYRYNLSSEVTYGSIYQPPRPLVDQEADIIQGLERMERHKIYTGIPFDRVMIFPWGISPENTLVLLKKYSFLATVNAQEIPLDAAHPLDWDFGMYQANLDFGNFPTLTRRHPGTYEPFNPNLQPFILDLFVDKPALFYSHEGELFASGIDTFNRVADQINNLLGEVEWRSLGYIITHLYLEKTNDDGSVDIKMYGNHLIISNESSIEKVYHIHKEEMLNITISSLTINGHKFPYRVEEGALMLDVCIPAHSTIEALIRYGD